MKTVRFKLDTAVQKMPAGRVNVRKLEGTSEADFKAQQKIDDAAAAQDAALFAQRVRKRLGLTQLEFSRRIDVSLNTIRNWEQGKRSPTGAARALLRVLDKAPEAFLMALGTDGARRWRSGRSLQSAAWCVVTSRKDRTRGGRDGPGLLRHSHG